VKSIALATPTALRTSNESARYDHAGSGKQASDNSIGGLMNRIES
jgi:hypothetical protein